MVSRYLSAAAVVSILFSSPVLASSDNSHISTLEMSSSTFQQPSPEVACELNVKEKYQYYDVDGSTVRDLQKQIGENGTKWNDGRTYAAVTSWDIHYNYDVTDKDGKCSIKSVKTDVDIVYHLPRRVSRKNGELTAKWDDYITHVKKHEYGHKDLAVKAAGEINETLASLPCFSSDAALEQEAKRRINEKMDQLKEVQIGYDHDTRHGETQGAVLDAD
jgi:predicted secreted Zn-dependent protease